MADNNNTAQAPKSADGQDKKKQVSNKRLVVAAKQQSRIRSGITFGPEKQLVDAGALGMTEEQVEAIEKDPMLLTVSVGKAQIDEDIPKAMRFDADGNLLQVRDLPMTTAMESGDADTHPHVNGGAKSPATEAPTRTVRITPEDEKALKAQATAPKGEKSNSNAAAEK